MSLYLQPLVVILWLIALGRTIAGTLALWQVKEYRFDRYQAHFTTTQGRRQLLNGAGPTRFVLGLITLFWLGGIVTPFVLLVGALAIYAGELLWSIGLFITGRFRRPAVTFKVIVLAALVLLSAVLAAWLIAPVSLIAGLFIAHSLVWAFSVVWILLLTPFNDLLKARLFARAGRYRDTLTHLTIVGITGSYGKTSTKMFLTQFLGQAGVKVIMSPGNVNTDVGLARFLLKEVTARHSVFVAEVGAYRRGEIKRVVDFLRPNIGILTAINDQHVALFGSRENLIKAKYELIEALPHDGVAIFNDDNTYCHTLANRTSHTRVVRFSRTHRTDVYAEGIRQAKQNLEFSLHAEGAVGHITAPILGTHLTSSILGAAAAAFTLGLPMHVIEEGSRGIKVPNSTMQSFRGINGATIIDDSYSANPDGVDAALALLREYPARRRFLVMRAMIELGEYGAAAHRALGEQIAKSCDFAFFVNHDFESEIREGAAANGMTGERLIFSRDAKKLAEVINDFIEAGDVVLLESRIPESLKKFIVKEK